MCYFVLYSCVKFHSAIIFIPPIDPTPTVTTTAPNPPGGPGDTPGPGVKTPEISLLTPQGLRFAFLGMQTCSLLTLPFISIQMKIKETRQFHFYILAISFC